MNTLDQLLDILWKQYIEINPRAYSIFKLLENEGEKVVNDHIAFRTYNFDKVSIPKLDRCFTHFGYEWAGEYHFPEKKLYAHHYQHENEHYPLVFISELKVEEFSGTLQTIVSHLVDQVPSGEIERWDFCACGRPWPVSFEQYQTLKQESEYAAWLAAFGFRANHFTIFVNELKNFAELSSLNAILKGKGFELNEREGPNKSSPEQLLEQSSTMAESVVVDFEDGPQEVPSCYYEFAKRYPNQEGKLYRGFIASSADKIFESTDNK